MPTKEAIKIRGARVHNLKNIDVDVPLGKIVGIAGVSGSGKSSLALGVLYAEGSRRYLDALSTYTRRRMTQAAKASVDEVLYVPAALALHQRPGVPGIRSTFGTGTELLNSLRLMFSRLASHRCPNGHYLPPSLAVAAEKPLICPTCGATVRAPSAEELAFNSQGACRTCDGTGTVRTVDLATLVPDPTLSIDDGAVAPWNSLMWSLMTDVCRAMGVRTDVPFNQLTDAEKEIVYHGPAEKKHIFYKAKNTPEAGELDFTYYNAVYTVENALAKVKDEKGMKRVEKFLKQETCPACHGTRLSEAARAPRLQGISLADACTMPLAELTQWVDRVPASLPAEMRPMAESICESFRTAARRLMDLGLDYLSLDRAASTLSTGERQRMQLARAVRNRTTGVLYVLDEPSIGLHPANIVGLTGVMHDLVEDGNSVVLVDHDTQVLAESDWIIEMGPEAGAGGGYVIAQGTVPEIEQDPKSMIGPFLRPAAAALPAGAGEERPLCRGPHPPFHRCHSHGAPAGDRHPQGQADRRHWRVRLRQDHADSGKPGACPCGQYRGPSTAVLCQGGNSRGHRAGQAHRCHAHRHQRAVHCGYLCQRPRRTAQDFCPHSGRQGPRLQGRRFLLQHGQTALPGVRWHRRHQPGRAVLAGCGDPLPRLPRFPLCPRGRRREADRQARPHYHTAPADGHCDVHTALDLCKDRKLVRQRLQVLQDLGLGYLTLGEETPSLSGGEAQRLKLASEMEPHPVRRGVCV